MNNLIAAGKNKKGFTLIEVLAAVIILGLAYIAVLQNFSLSMKNITRIEKARTNTLEKTLAFEQLLSPPEDEPDQDTDLPLFLEGSYYQLVVVAAEDDDIVSLKLERITY